MMKLPEKYHALIAENQPRIREIVVTETKSTTPQSEPAFELEPPSND